MSSAPGPGDPPHRSHDSWIAAARAEFEQVPARTQAWPTADAGERLGELDTPFVDSLPGYRFLEEINRGGQAVVYRATQLGTQRDVAIKVIRQPAQRNAAAHSRFEREVQILGQLKHPNIVKILDSGTARGRLYYIMDYVPGLALDEYITRHRPSIRERMELFAKICSALNVAHLRGVTHRDLKPGNIRIDPAGEPHLLDFGLAKVDEFDDLAQGMARTMTGDFVGSLPWASPEQVEGRPDDLDIRTDVYAIGVMLFRALAGRPPYEVNGPLREAMNNICHAEPPPLRSISREVDDELSAIVERCLRKAPEERYQSAGDLARELDRYLKGEAIEAKRDSSWYLLRKAIHRHRGRAAVALLLLATAAYSVALLTYLYHKETRLRTEAQTALREAETQSRIASAVNDFLHDDLLAAARPEKLGRDVTVVEVLDKASASLRDRFGNQPDVKMQLHHTLGNSYFELGRTDRALDEWQAGYELVLAQPRSASYDETRHAFMTELSRGFERSGRLTEMEMLTRKTLEFSRLRFGENHETTVTATGNHGWSLYRLGSVEEGAALMRIAYEGAIRVHGAGSEHTQYWATSLGGMLSSEGRLDEAVPLLQQALELARRLWGEEHPSSASAMGALAGALRVQGRATEAIALYEQAVRIRQRHLGDGHPGTLLMLNNLASAYAGAQNNAKAQLTFEQGLRDGEASLETAHPTLVTMRSNLASIYDRLYRHVDAERLHRTALEQARGNFPRAHPTLALYLFRLGECLRLQGCDEEAEGALRDGYAMAVEVSGVDAAVARDCAMALARLFESRSDEVGVMTWEVRASGHDP